MNKCCLKIYISKLLSKEKEKLIEFVDDADVVSFDIFDTLVKRKVDSPDDIFELIANDYDFAGEESFGRFFKETRKTAERVARCKSQYEEVTLNEIYDCFKGLNVLQKEKLIETECKNELNNCVCNADMYGVYQYAKKMNKRIIYTSDMYLDNQTVKKILKNCGYDDYPLYLSSEIRKTKRSGKLFEYIRMEYPNCKVAHFGDNIVRDYFMAKLQGIKGVLIKSI